jgi:hypothetical protein
MKKFCFRRFLNQKVHKSIHTVSGVIFVYSGWLGVIYDSQGDQLECAGGGGGFRRESSQLPGGRLGVIDDSQPHGNELI